MQTSRVAMWCLRLSLLGALGVAGLSCGEDDSGKGGGDQDGNNDDGDDTTDDGSDDLDASTGSPEPDPDDPVVRPDNPTGDGGTCADGDTRACTCEDGTTEGQQFCYMGDFVGECQGCPCEDGTKQACLCQGGGIGSQLCTDMAFGACDCEAGAAGPCPDGFICQDIGGQGSVCGEPGGGAPFALPPECTDNASCVAAGLSNAECLSVPVFGSRCVQSCSDAPVDPTPDAGTPDGGA